MENAIKNAEIIENEVTESPTLAEIHEKAYTFRKLSTQDIFPMLRFLNKIGLKHMKEDDGIKNIILQFTGEAAKGEKANVEKLGIDMFLELACLISDSIPKCEAEFYGILSSTSNLSVEQIKAQDMATTFEMIVDFIRKEEFGDFFKAVLKLFK